MVHRWDTSSINRNIDQNVKDSCYFFFGGGGASRMGASCMANSNTLNEKLIPECTEFRDF